MTFRLFALLFARVGYRVVDVQDDATIKPKGIQMGGRPGQTGIVWYEICSLITEFGFGLKIREVGMLRADETKMALRRQKELPRLANSLAGCVRWRIGDIEEILLAEIALLTRRTSNAEARRH
jgi:hypothetical protein